MDSKRIASNAKDDPKTHLTMVNHAFQLIEDDILDQVEVFKKIYIEDKDTYKELVDKLKSKNLYD
jgi:hypothetical protein